MSNYVTPSVANLECPPFRCAIDNTFTQSWLTPAMLILEGSGSGRSGSWEAHRTWPTEQQLADRLFQSSRLGESVMDSLQSSRVFLYAGAYDGTHRTGYLLTGRLEKLDEIDYGGQVRVEATVPAQMVDLRTGTLAWSGSATNTANVEGHDVYSVVNQMSRAVDLCLEKLVLSMSEGIDRRDVATR